MLLNVKARHSHLRLPLLSAVALLCTLGCTEKYVKPELTAELKQGKAIVLEKCRVCHIGGLRYAPILGNQEMWAPRIAKGEDTLVDHALHGFNQMPPRGGNPELSNDQIRLAVRYLMFAGGAHSGQ